MHQVSYKFNQCSNYYTQEQYLQVTIKDTFDFTEWKNPFSEDSIKAGFLWLANDIAYIDTRWGLLDPVDVEITVFIPANS